jgi:hypothetical protein
MKRYISALLTSHTSYCHPVRIPDNTVAVVRDNKLALYIMQKGGSKAQLTSAEIQILMTHAGRSLTHYMMPK